MNWVRTMIRADGADWRSPDAKRVPGPWHVVSDTPSHGTLTRCGKTPRALSKQFHEGDEPPEGKMCRPCEIAVEQGVQRPVRRRR